MEEATIEDQSEAIEPIETIHKSASEITKEIAENSYDWKAGHVSSLTKMRTLYQEYINKLLQGINEQLGEPLNGWNFLKLEGPNQLVLKAENEFKNLKSRSGTYRADRNQLLDSMQGLNKRFPNVSEESLQNVKTIDIGDWWLFIGIMLICILVEAVANVSLLIAVLTTGMLGAFIVAVLVSVLNVGIAGAGVGFLISFFHRHSGRLFKGAIPLLCSTWVLLMLLLNLFIGRHRENFSRILEQQIAGEIVSESQKIGSMNEALQSAESISFNVAEWQFESLLFFLLGIGLCAFAFLRAYSFIKPGSELADRFKSLSEERNRINVEFHALPERYQKELTDRLRPEVANYVQNLHNDCNAAEVVFEDVRDDWDKGQILARMEADFVSSHNVNHAGKVSLDMLRSHREEQKIDTSFPVTRADENVLDDAKQICEKWKAVSQDEFFTNITDRTREISNMWDRYKDPILGPLTPR